MLEEMMNKLVCIAGFLGLLFASVWEDSML